VARGAPRLVPAAARIVAGPGNWRRDLPRSIPAVAGPGGLHGGLAHETMPRMTGPGMFHGEPHGNPAGAPQRAWPEHPNPSAAVARPEAHPFARPEPAGQHMSREFRPPEGYHPATAAPQYGRPEVPRMTAPGQQFGRPEAFHTPAPTYRAGGQQFGRPEVSQSSAAMPRPGAPQVVRPGAPAVFGRGSPAGMARGAPQVAARPAAPAPQKKK
jgi:hypothetical protein